MRFILSLLFYFRKIFLIWRILFGITVVKIIFVSFNFFEEEVIIEIVFGLLYFKGKKNIKLKMENKKVNDRK